MQLLDGAIEHARKNNMTIDHIELSSAEFDKFSNELQLIDFPLTYASNVCIKYNNIDICRK